MKRYAKRDFPVGDARRFLEPRPIVLVSSAWKGKTNIMTMGWYMPMEFQPSLVGCVISNANHSFELIRRSRECVINVPTVDLAPTVVRIGNTSGHVATSPRFPKTIHYRGNGLFMVAGPTVGRWRLFKPEML